MTPQSDDDLELSVYADWLEDEGRSLESQWVRESLTESPRKWERQYRHVGVGVVGFVGGSVGDVGGVGGGSVSVGGGIGVGSVGVGGIGVGSVGVGVGVGVGGIGVGSVGVGVGVGVGGSY